MIPCFAVVGHPNKGKSSIVSTLAEDPSVAIADTPGTTTRSRRFPLRVDGEVLYELIDTPGFQRPRQVMAWLEAHCSSTEDRAATVERFLQAHQDDDKFRDECELLRPLVAGAGILYVVDGSHPFGTEYEAEMQILRWTGQPRMALINPISNANHVDSWRRALDQYFSIVRVFDPMRSDFAERLALLRSFGELHLPWRDAIERAVAALEADFSQRRAAAAQQIANLIASALSARQIARIANGESAETVIAALKEKLRADLRLREGQTRREIESIYRHDELQSQVAESRALDSDLFSSESKQLFGLSKRQLVTTAAMSGAVAGGSIDVLLGGASLLAGAGAGAILGGVSALFGAERLGKVKLMGQSLASRETTVGPFRDPNLPWILLGRACLHHELVSERNHARREHLTLEAQASRHRADRIDDTTRRELTVAFTAISKHGYDPSQNDLKRLIEKLLAVHNDESFDRPGFQKNEPVRA